MKTMLIVASVLAYLWLNISFMKSRDGSLGKFRANNSIAYCVAFALFGIFIEIGALLLFLVILFIGKIAEKLSPET